MKMTRKNGIIEVVMHSDGGPLNYLWDMHELWGQAWREIGSDPENQVIIISGSGDKWLVGDPSLWKVPFAQWPGDAKLKMRMDSQKLLENIVWGVDVPIIACVNGPGVHVEFAMLCDLTLVADDVDFWDPHFIGGTAPGDGMALVLQQLIGIKRASYYAYTGKKITSQMAVDMGLADESMPREQLLPRARELAEMIMDRPRGTRYMTHTILQRPWKKALTEDQTMHITSQDFSQSMDEIGVYARLQELKKSGRL